MDRVYKNADKFNDALLELLDEFEGETLQLVRMLTWDLANTIIARTPRDTGRARAGWQLTMDNPSSYVPPKGRYNKKKARQPGISDEYWITNNVEYIQYLEDGASKQAPSGMVATSLLKFSRRIGREARKLRLG